MSSINSQTKLAAVIGCPIDHSLSPVMQNAAIEALGLDMVYLALHVEPEQIGAALAGARAMGFIGLNVTIPHKESVIEHLDRVDDHAKAIGAVNTIHNVDGELIGYNTDAYGFTATIMAEAELILRDQTVLVLGGGGVARAIAAGVAAEGARKVIVANRTRARADAIVADMEPVFPDTRWEAVQMSPPSLKNAADRSEVIANATSLGMKSDDPMPIKAECISPEHVVFDSVYRPAKTPLLKAAKDAGAIGVGGLGMLARQGAKSLAIWTGCEPDEELMFRALKKHAFGGAE